MIYILNCVLTVKEENMEMDEEMLTVKQEDIADNIQLNFDESVRRQPLSSFIIYIVIHIRCRHLPDRRLHKNAHILTNIFPVHGENLATKFSGIALWIWTETIFRSPVGIARLT